MEEASAELLYLPIHRERQPSKNADRLATPEADQQTLQELFDYMVEVAAMPTQHADRLVVDAVLQGDDLDQELVIVQLNQRQNKGQVFTESVDSVVLVRRADAVSVVEYSRTYYQGKWRQGRKTDELQYNWVQDYQDGSLGVVDAVFTADVAGLHIEEARQEINRRAQEQRQRFMMGEVVISRLVN